MSYEGREQYLCENGHYTVLDALSEDNDLTECPVCRARIVWSNSVDDTNCEAEGYVTLETKTVAEYETCPTCRVCRMVKPATYVVPPVGVGHHYP